VRSSESHAAARSDASSRPSCEPAAWSSKKASPSDDRASSSASRRSSRSIEKTSGEIASVAPSSIAVSA
jgi:hypothetical protein